MDFSVYLAMAPEQALPEGLRKAFLFCPFEENGMPEFLPPECLPVLTDRTPFSKEKSIQLIDRLSSIASGCHAVLLDFQRNEQTGLAEFVQELGAALSCPIAAPPEYAGPAGPVFLPPIPPDVMPEEALAPWQGRQIWLDLAPSALKLTLTAGGCSSTETSETGTGGFRDRVLLCHYRAETILKDRVQFALWRTGEDLSALTARLPELGVCGCVGLYPELNGCGFLKAPPLPGPDR